jgi:hypothetical protein
LKKHFDEIFQNHRIIYLEGEERVEKRCKQKEEVRRYLKEQARTIWHNPSSLTNK